MSMGGAAARRKGHNWERENRIKFSSLYPEAERCLQFREGSLVPDVLAGPLAIECKVGKKTNIRGALRQAEESVDYLNNKKGRKFFPVSSCKDDRTKPILSMYLDDFLEFVREIQGKQNV